VEAQQVGLQAELAELPRVGLRREVVQAQVVGLQLELGPLPRVGF
jgi:hypothetical protein